MSSLIKKALQLRQETNGNSIVPVSDELFESESGITAQDRDKIIVELNDLVDETRIEVKPSTFSFVSQRKGSALPVMVNVLVLSALVIAGALIFHFFDLREESIARPAEVETAEAEVLEAIKKQSELQLREKDLQITGIQGNLEELRRERGLLQLEADTKLREREDALRKAFQEELEAERQRLQREGLSQEQIDQIIRRLEEEKQAELERELESLRAQLNSQRAETEAALNADIARYENELRESFLERSDLMGQLDEQKADLERRFREREDALEAERDLMAAQLETARTQQERGDSALRQILVFYEKVNQSLSDNNYDRAIRELDDLLSYLNESSVATLNVIQQRRQVELFLVASLRTLIENQRTAEERQVEVGRPEIGLLASISSTVDRGDRFFEAGDMKTAETLYMNALEKIAAVQRGYLRLREIQSLSSKLESQELYKKIEEGDAFYTAKDYQAAVDSYHGALDYLDVDSETTERMLERILDVGYKIGISREKAEVVRDSQDLIRRAESRQREILERLLSIQQASLDAMVDAKATGITTREKLIFLLRAKIRVKQVLDSESIRSVYPELYDQMDQYLAALSEEQRSLGYTSALSDIGALVEVLSGEGIEENLHKTWDHLDTGAQVESFSRLLEGLRSLLGQSP